MRNISVPYPNIFRGLVCDYDEIVLTEIQVTKITGYVVGHGFVLVRVVNRVDDNLGYGSLV
jgi:hypothetical protein